jgi:adenylyltransferase/sulfurtransferase
MSSVRIPTPLRPYAEGQKDLTVNGATVAAALEQLTEEHPGLRQHLFDDQGQLRAYVNVFLNDEDIRGLEGAETPIAAEDRLTIVPSIAGGSGVRP